MTPATAGKPAIAGMPETLETPAAEGTSTSIVAATRAETLATPDSTSTTERSTATAGPTQLHKRELDHQGDASNSRVTRTRWNWMLTTVGTQVTADTATTAGTQSTAGSTERWNVIATEGTSTVVGTTHSNPAPEKIEI